MGRTPRTGVRLRTIDPAVPLSWGHQTSMTPRVRAVNNVPGDGPMPVGM